MSNATQTLEDAIKQIVEETIDDHDFSQKIDSAMEDYNPTNSPDFEKEVESIVENKLDDYDPTEAVHFESAVENVLDDWVSNNSDFNTAVESVVEDQLNSYDPTKHDDFESAVEGIVETKLDDLDKTFVQERVETYLDDFLKSRMLGVLNSDAFQNTLYGLIKKALGNMLINLTK